MCEFVHSSWVIQPTNGTTNPKDSHLVAESLVGNGWYMLVYSDDYAMVDSGCLWLVMVDHPVIKYLVARNRNLYILGGCLGG